MFSFQASKCDDVAEHRQDFSQEPEELVNAAYDYYKNLYLNIYGDPSKTASPTSAAAPPKKKGLFNRQDLDSMLSPDNAVSNRIQLSKHSSILVLLLFCEKYYNTLYCNISVRPGPYCWYFGCCRRSGCINQRQLYQQPQHRPGQYLQRGK